MIDEPIELNNYDRGNPPAYPNAWDNDGAPGMTLRDHFAGIALPYSLKYCEGGPPADVPKLAAQDAYRIADAMLAERMVER